MSLADNAADAYERGAVPLHQWGRIVVELCGWTAWRRVWKHLPPLRDRTREHIAAAIRAHATPEPTEP